ncbi:MAG: DUF2249 domain-containing protein [Sulfuriferula sp.]
MLQNLKIFDGQSRLVDVRSVARRFRHAAISALWMSCSQGRSCIRQRPLPLIDQMHQRYGGTIEVEYVERQHVNIVIRFARR